MLNLKKTALAVLAFSSSAVFAGTMGPVCVPGSVTIPCAHSAWDFGGQALYLQTNYSGNSFNGLTLDSADNGTINRFNDGWGWGFMIEGSYHFDTGSDLNLNWYHLDHSATRNLFVPAGSLFIEDVTSLPGSAGPFNMVRTRKSQWDAVNLEFGQHVDFGVVKNIRFHGGAQYARINTKGSIVGTVSRAVSPNTDTSNYNGFGPRVGADMSYAWWNGFGLYANAATALLIGTSKYSDTFDSTIIRHGTLSASTTAFVPELEAKLGATFTYAVGQGDLDLNVGWMWVNYFNSHLHPDYLLSPLQTNFSEQGPFLGLKWVGNLV